MSTLQRIARRAGATLVVLAIASLCATADAGAQCGQEYRGAPASSTVPGGPPLAIGDSVLADAVPQLVRYGFEADGMVCRQMSQGLELLRTRGAHLPHLVVLALGANGEVTMRQIDEALALLGPQRILVLVTPHGGVLPSTPGVIRAAAAANPSRIALLDWDRLADEHRDWLAPDGVHLGGSAGIDGFAAMIAGTLRYATPESAESEDINPGAPETLPSPPAHRSHPTHRALTPRSSERTTNAKAPAAPLPVSTSTPKRVAADKPARSSSRLARGTIAAIVGGIVLAALALLAWRRTRHLAG
jgi:hypothetical protein